MQHNTGTMLGLSSTCKSLLPGQGSLVLAASLWRNFHPNDSVLQFLQGQALVETNKSAHTRLGTGLGTGAVLGRVKEKLTLQSCSRATLNVSSSFLFINSDEEVRGDSTGMPQTPALYRITVMLWLPFDTIMHQTLHGTFIPLILPVINSPLLLLFSPRFP